MAVRFSKSVANPLRRAWKRIRNRPHQSALIILLAGIAIGGARVNSPSLLLDLAGVWDACPMSGESGACEWRAVKVPAHFVARPGDSFTNYVQYRRSFRAPAGCLARTCKLIFAEVGDSAEVELNGVIVSRPTVELQHVYEKNFPLGLDVPPDVLRAGSDNDLVVRVHSFRDQQVGLRMGPIGLTTNKDGNAFLHWRAFRNVYVPLMCSIAAALIVFLCGFLPHQGVTRGVWRCFYAYATASAFFMFSFTEIPRALWPMALVIPAHFFLRFYTDFALFRLLVVGLDYDAGWLWKVGAWVYRSLLALFLVLFAGGLAGELAGAEWATPGYTFSLVLFAYPASIVMPLVVAATALKSRRPWLACAMFAFTLAVLHEWAIGSGFVQAEFLSKYYHLAATGAFIVVLTRRTARAQAENAMAATAERELAQLARQVDHDIRSPLAALDVVSRSIGSAPENVRTLHRMAIDRIRDIANSLRQRQNTEAAGMSSHTGAKALMLVSVVDTVISEKRITCVNRLQNIEHELTTESYSVFVLAQSGVLKRVLSNLLNNAIEAVGQTGRVQVEVRTREGDAQIVVTDNGPGIPTDVLARWGERGMTVGKSSGSGLGVHHAVSSIEAFGGSVSGRNLEHGGAEVTVTLPRCEPPLWFAPRVNLIAGQTVVVVDDDRAVHAAWRERLRGREVAIRHFSSAEQLQHWLDAKPDTPITYFIDYELGDGACNGMTIIKQWPLEGDAYLVTSHFETPDVVEQCEAQEIVMMPKSLVGVVPLECQVGAMG